MAQPGGPSYEYFEKLLPPLRYVNAAFRHYPIALCAPFSPFHARLVSNGSAVNARANLGTWKEVGFPVAFHVGKDSAAFGDDPRSLDGPHLADGCLPIVQLGYRHGGATYEQEVFVGTEKPFADAAGVFVRFALRAGSAGTVAAQFDFDQPLEAADGFLRDSQGSALAWFDAGWRWNGERRRLSADLARGTAAHLVIFTRPTKEALPSIAHDKQRSLCASAWNGLLQRGMRLETPEPIVNNAWRSLIVGAFQHCRDARLDYSVGNQYARQYEAECGDALRALMLFGFRDEALRMIEPLLDYKQKGLSFHDAGFKLQMLAHCFWLSRDAEFIRQQRGRWSREANHIIQSIEADTGLLPREDYCGDINVQVRSLNSNANSWRGLRDLGVVLEAIGEREPAQRMTKAAGDLRKAILAAADKSERRDVQPPFMPIALFGEEQPYSALTSSKQGSYWCLMAPYVLGSGVFGDESERTGWMIDYLHERGGVCMGMIRFHQHSKLFACENGLDDLYGLRYVLTLLRRDEADRALVSFYGKLAHGLTRGTFIGAEGTSLIPLDEFGRPMYLPPNSASNGLSLWTLRYLLVQDWDTDDDGRPETLRLLFATPSRWLADGASLKLERAPTAFGEVSLHIQSRLSAGEVLAQIVPPLQPPKRTLLRIRLPSGWKPASARIGMTRVPIAADGTLDISGRRDAITVRVAVKKAAE